MQITATIVLYRNDKEMLSKAIHSFLNTSLDVKLYLVDNSPLPELESIVSDPRVEYFYLNANRGFGSGHNVIMRRPDMMGKYHLVLNPDIYFEKGTLESLFEYMENNLDVANVMPRIVFPNGQIQNMCKLLPRPIDWIGRRFIPFKLLRDKIDNSYELRSVDYDKEMNIPFLSGCFMFIRSSVICEGFTFDERFFMYCEDTDLCRRIHSKYKTIYYPKVQVIHNCGYASHKSLKMLKIHIKSAISYFNKWGWFFDNERKAMNTETIKLYTK